VKETDSEVLEDIGCWNVWESVQFNDKAPRHSSVTEKLNLGMWCCDALCCSDALQIFPIQKLRNGLR
jgi:hypothetical protein